MDLISRQAAIGLCDWYEYEFSECRYVIKSLTRDLKRLPTAEPRWIPVSERLPERGVTVLAYGLKDISIAWRDNGEHDWEWRFDDFELNGEERNYVLAWMPLPKPYKGGEE